MKESTLMTRPEPNHSQIAPYRTALLTKFLLKIEIIYYSV